ncbi:DUF5994 family protein [Sphaerisporangium aureirubrum]|uniref:DUF5994 family protein n=1 Tax=Sphaerisporangium aureirubrum TaxID=1544736 RepID=A0ABW1NRC4_9ACTN
MRSTAERATTISPSPPSTPRVRLEASRSRPTLLDGGWWPRSADPVAELPGLILALDDRYGHVERVMLGTADWDGRPRRLRVDGPAGRRAVRLGWFDTMPAGLLTATYGGGRRIDLLTVPSHTSAAEAEKAMDQAAQPGNTVHTPEILSAITSPPDHTEARTTGEGF